MIIKLGFQLVLLQDSVFTLDIKVTKHNLHLLQFGPYFPSQHLLMLASFYQLT